MTADARRAGPRFARGCCRRDVVVGKLGVELIPPEFDPVRITWDFRDGETPIWDSQNGRASRGSQGLILVPGAEPAMMGSVWAFGVGLTVYYQLAALAVDVESFGRVSRAAAYGVIDGAPLWEDIQAISRALPHDSTVDVVVGAARQDPLVNALWTGRAAYYLYPVRVHPAAPVAIYYTGGPHPPCSQIASGREVLDEGARYCLLGARS